MKKRKSLYQDLLPSFLAAMSLNFIVFGLIACAPIKVQESSVLQYQKAKDLVDQGTLLLRAMKPEQARGAFAAAIDLAPLAAAIDGLGCVAFIQQDFVAAEKYFVKAFEVDPNYYASLGNLALLYDIKGLSEKAKKLYSMALEAEPGNFRSRNNYAVYLLAADDKAAGKLELLKALALAKHPTITGNLKRLEEYE